MRSDGLTDLGADALVPRSTPVSTRQGRSTPRTTTDRLKPSYPATRALATLLGTVLSFEALFTLFLYSNNLKMLLPPLPGDETIIFLVLSIPGAGLALMRQGLRLRGLHVLAVGLLFFAWMALALLWTPGQEQALRKVAYNLVFNLYALAVGCLVLTADPRRLRRFLACVVVVGLVLAGKGLWIWVNYRSFRFYENFAEIRIYLAWGYPAATAAGIVLAGSLTWPLGGLRQLFATTVAGTLVFFLLIATGRGPLLAVAASLAVPLLVFTPVFGPRRLEIPRAQLLALGILFVATVYVSYLLATGQLGNTLGRFLALYGDIENDAIFRRFSRINYWRESLAYWSRAPLFGNGPGSFSILYLGREEAGTHPHNILLEIAVELGLVGLGLFAALVLVSIAGVSLERLRREPEYLCVWMAFAGIAVGAMVSVDLASQAPLFVALGLLSLAPAVRAGDNGNRAPGIRA